jgi:hypothetical protein
MKIDILKHTLVNVKKSVTFWMNVVEKKFFSTILDNMMEYKTPVLSHLWDKLEIWSKILRKYYMSWPKGGSTLGVEGLKIVRDWSRNTFWNGYVWHWVSIKGIPLFLDREWNYTVKIDWIKEKLFIFVKKLKWQINPIRVISNKNCEDNILKYLKRWDIERIFKTMKQEYNKLQIEEKSESISFKFIIKKINPFFKKMSLTLNRNSI